MSLLTKIRTAWRLGPGSVCRVMLYRLRLRLRLHPVQRIKAEIPIDQPFFRQPPAQPRKQNLPISRHWRNQHCYFDWFTVDNPDNQPPDWFLNPFTGKRITESQRPWWRIPDFNPEFGDIKTIWEPSRFGWLLDFAQQAVQDDNSALNTLNHWLQDWAKNNPPYLGPNWKCGQEASIRVMHLAMTALLLEQKNEPEPALLSMLRALLLRIAPTVSYAMAQKNNHSTSEAAALFIGGSWLAHCGHWRSKKWCRKGRRQLENQAVKLIESDGSFSQYSVNYHRVMLDTYCMTEAWRQSLNLKPFSPLFYQRLQSAADWLRHMTEPLSGNAPNLGANDGARLLPLTDTDYRDYRPTLERARKYFNGHGKHENSQKKSQAPQILTHFPDGGYMILRAGDNFAVLRYPRFRFRPGHADALHLDLWHKGENILRDGGSFSYSDREAMAYFTGTASHNTVQFDDRDQMPRLGRFLFGDWLKAEEVNTARTTDDVLTVGAGYTDNQGARHHRTITISENRLTVEDRISGFINKAVLRWRLQPGEWTLDNNIVSNGAIKLSVIANIQISNLELTTGFESLYYLKQTELPVLQATVKKPGIVRTEVSFES